jgi:hypothetical protein
VLAISAGTVVGLVVANYLSGGMITPILAAGSESAPAIASAPAAAVGAVEMAPAAAAAGVTEVVAAAPAAGAAMAAAPAAAATTVMAGASYGVMAARSAVLVAGAAIGGYVGNWIYGK